MFGPPFGLLGVVSPETDRLSAEQKYPGPTETLTSGSPETLEFVSPPKSIFILGCKYEKEKSQRFMQTISVSCPFCFVVQDATGPHGELLFAKEASPVSLNWI